MPFVCALKLDPGITSHLPLLAADERTEPNPDAARCLICHAATLGRGDWQFPLSFGHASLRVGAFLMNPMTILSGSQLLHQCLIFDCCFAQKMQTKVVALVFLFFSWRLCAQAPVSSSVQWVYYTVQACINQPSGFLFFLVGWKQPWPLWLLIRLANTADHN